MSSRFANYEKALDALVEKGRLIFLSMQLSVDDAGTFRAEIEKRHGDKTESFIAKLPSFLGEYQTWYSEAKAVIRQLLPDRLADFCRHYERPSNRKEITVASYSIEDFLQHLHIPDEVPMSSGFSRMRQQYEILSAARKRLDSTLHDIQQLVAADVYDSEVAQARELAKLGYLRPAGVICGVVLEKHLELVCGAHNVKISKKKPTLADLNDALKDAQSISVAQWRFIQHLGDLRNKCAHNTGTEPSSSEVVDLTDGTAKVIKTIA